jgi:hypothetical protein
VPGTTVELAAIGVRYTSELTRAAYPDMPRVTKGWMQTNAFFKAEEEQINIGLGRGRGLDLFNNNIKGYNVIRE